MLIWLPIKEMTGVENLLNSELRPRFVSSEIVYLLSFHNKKMSKCFMRYLWFLNSFAFHYKQHYLAVQ